MKIPKVTLEQWAVVATIIDQGGFAPAAAVLHRSQSAVSYAVARLQDSLGIPILKTEGRKSVLTTHGRILLTRARALLHDAEALELQARGLLQGWEADLSLVVDAAFPRSVLLKIVAELQQSCPHTQIQLADAVLSGAEDAITEGSADVVITSRVPAGFLGDLIHDVEFACAARTDHPLLQLGRLLTVSDLARHTQTVIRDSGTTHRRNDGWLGADHRFTVSSMEASLATLLAGLAFAWLPVHMLTPHFEQRQLVRLPLLTGGTRRVPLYLVQVHPDLPGPAVRAAVDAFSRHSVLRNDG